MTLRERAGELWMVTAFVVALLPSVARGQDGMAPAAVPVEIPQTSATDAESVGFLGVVGGSIFGHNDPATHTLLGFHNLREGWNESWIPPGPGSSGSLRGIWVGAPNGFFSREVDTSYSFLKGIRGGPDEHVGAITLFTPLSRRLEIGINVPFLDSVDFATGSQTSFGDVRIVPRVMLLEDKDTSVSAGVIIRTPTGETRTGNGLTAIDPFIVLWSDLGQKWQARAGLDLTVPIDKGAFPGFPDAVLSANVSIGKTIGLSEHGFLTDVTPYVAINFHQPFNSGDDDLLISFTPGARITLAKNCWLIGGVEIPVTGPRPFEAVYTAVLSIGW